MGYHFNVKARRATENILENYEYCVVRVIPYGSDRMLPPIKCTSVDEVEDLYNSNYDIYIETPCGCSY